MRPYKHTHEHLILTLLYIVSPDNAIYGESLTDVLRTTVSGDSSVMFLEPLAVSHDSAVMVALTQMFLELWECNYGVLHGCSYNPIELWQCNYGKSLTDVIGTTACPNKHALRSHWAQYSVSSRDCSLVLVGDSLTDVLWIPVSCDMNNG